MIRRHANLNVYKEIFSSKDFIRTAVGAFLIPGAYLAKDIYLQPLPAVSVMDMILMISILINGVPIIIEAVKGIAQRQVNVDELVSIAIVACIVTGNFLEAAVVSSIMVAGALVEEAVSDSARNAIESLVQMTPDTALLEKNGEEVTVTVSQIARGDILLVKTGGVIPVDGTVTDGACAVDESAVTGESVPKPKAPGDEVWAGTLNTDGFIRVRAERVGRDSTMGKIISMVTAAEQSKVQSAKIVDRYAGWFTPVILSCALLTFIITRDIERAITVLIVGCPCSFILAGPVATVSAIGNASRHGILVKGGIYLENMGKALGIFFDKTGTLTSGEPAVKEVVCAQAGMNKKNLIRIAGALELKMNHPLARAIVQKARDWELNIPDARDIINIPGRGIRGNVAGQAVEIMASDKFSDNGYTCVEIRIDQQTAGWIYMQDQPRTAAAKVIRQLKSQGIKDLAVLSGDQDAPVKMLCDQIGIDTVWARQSPADKLRLIQGYDRGMLVYVGDGVNDAPALKAADTGIAMGLNGSDAALDTADIVLMNDRLENLVYLFSLGRTLRRTIQICIAVSFLINLGSVISGSMGWLTPVWGAVTHNAGSLIVVGLSASIGYFAKKNLDGL
ncbi:MAG: cadmium-translocating P-type ATPase [Desulfobacterales bacterium]|nr:cadmium-translocating P-type ATPase [Desulfobacterales bacterium]